MSECQETFRAFDMDEPVACTEEEDHTLHTARDPVTAAMLVWGDLPEPSEEEDTIRIVGNVIDEKHMTLIGDVILAFDDAAEYHDKVRHADDPAYGKGKHCMGERMSLLGTLCLHVHASDERMKSLVEDVRKGRPIQEKAEADDKGHASPYEEAP